MPPRAAGSNVSRPPRGGRGGSDRGGGAGTGTRGREGVNVNRGAAPPARGGGAASTSIDRGHGRGRGVVASPAGVRAGDRNNRPSPSIADHVNAVGVKRRDFGTAGRVIKVRMNSYEVQVPDDKLYQYDATDPDDLSKRLRLRLMDKLQVDQPTIFLNPVLYDGRAIMFTKQNLKLGPKNVGAQEFDVVLDTPRPGAKPPQVFKIKITKVAATVNLQVLHEFVAGRYSQDSFVQMAEMALNIAIRMHPGKKYPSNARSFFVEDGKTNLTGGLEVRRGYFQSLRPSIGRILLNLDISAAVFYRSGPLTGIALDFLGIPGNRADLLARISDHERRRLAKFLHLVKIVKRDGKSKPQSVQAVVGSADSILFQHETYGNITVAAFFKRHRNVTLQFPKHPCVKVGKTAVIPMELCDVVPGQFSHNDLTPDQTKKMVEFSTMYPPQRFDSIQKGLQMLEYGQSQYVRECGITVNPVAIEVDARILPEPALKVAHNPDPRKSQIIPGNGKWNMLNCKFYHPARISGFMVMIFESERRFSEDSYKNMVTGFVNAARDFGVGVDDPVPLVKWVNGRPNIRTLLLESGREYIKMKKAEHKREKQAGPSLILAVLPPNSKELYNDIKRFGYIQMGIATQCLLSNKCSRANHQYWANILLKVNVKLGGTNFVPNMPFIDQSKPTIIMGADAIHPPPGATGKPSFTAVVSSVDSVLCKYVASNGMQDGGKEMIKDLEGMVANALDKWKDHQMKVEKKSQDYKPMRLFYFRDGVSEGEFQQALDKELTSIQRACEAKKYSPKITIVIVVKRHHHRAMAVESRDADPKSFNVPAGSTIDTGVVHPVESDYLQYTHGGILGTSRPGKYTILHDENEMKADAIQALTYGLAHSFARSTRSVSIPAPVYYAHLVCAKRAVHFDPSANFGSDTASVVSGAGGPSLQAYRDAWSPINQAQSGVMYWM